ncbi:type VI secretion system Vgr family protein [Massilia sp. CT11-137]|uniref:type VI secretion system Vgr family protein n=1 Tax=Massilia sp. CT11-137 TaxID=3393901 RepID=UPI0039B00BA5
MPLLPTQAHREVAVSSVLGGDVLLFKSMQCSEALGRLSEFRIELASRRGDIGIADVLGTGMTVSVDLPQGGKRHFHGIVTRFAYQGWRDGLPSYLAIVRPALWLLTRSTNCRIFQGLDAIAIVKDVIEEYGAIALDESRVTTTPASREYCVQYRESDFDFVCRLLEEEGIYFYFTHADGEHTIVLADGYGAHDTVSGYDTIPFCDEEMTSNALGEAVTRLNPGGEIQPSMMVLDDFDFEKASSSLSGGLVAKASVPAPFGQKSYEHYDYPGRYNVTATGDGFARARMEALHGQGERIEAAASARGVTTGALFSLSGHPRDDQNRTFLVTSAETSITGVDYLSNGGGNGVRFECSFVAIGKEHSYRPPPTARKPIVQGPQTAMVVGKANEEIWTDKYGRIKVQFHWERDGKSDETSSCWVRVQQGWAGKGWGMMFVPRVGMEVVVSFLEGDPDRPLVTGCVYNSDSMPPYTLPADQTKSTIKSNTSKGGNGFNEIRFEDKKDSEEIFVQAEKDFNRVVKNNDTLKVGFEKKDKGDQTIEIANDQSLDVGNDRKVHVKNDQTVAIDNNLSTTVKNDETRKVDNNQSVKVGNKIVIEANTSIELKVGGSSIKIEAAKITIKAPEIAVQSDANTEIKAGAMMQVKSGAVMTIEGALVKIN